MDLPTARQVISAALDRMRALYHKPVFEEWAIVAFGAKHGGILAYNGPRMEEFMDRFQADIAPLRAAIAERPLGDGDFDFVSDATGTRHDAVIRIGDGSYLVFNNLSKTMADIRAAPRWINAQPAFAELSDRFRNDPLETI